MSKKQNPFTLTPCNRGYAVNDEPIKKNTRELCTQDNGKKVFNIKSFALLFYFSAYHHPLTFSPAGLS
jgi:hypothetical protein